MYDKPITRREILTLTALIGGALAGVGLGHWWPAFRKKIGKPITRAELFATMEGALAGMSLILGWLYRENLEDITLDTLDKIVEIPTFNPFPPEFNYMASNDHCNVIVHSGYSVTDWSTKHLRGFYHGKTDKFGSYPDFLENIEQFIEYLTESDELAISAEEKTTFYDGEYAEGLSPPDSALKIITRNGKGTIKKYIKTSDGVRKQEIETIYSFLESKGISDVWLAGEWADGCLHKIASYFNDAGFNIKGIEGCIYPTIPQRNDEVSEKLYNNMVQLPFLKQIRATGS